ncbi:MAG: hypothetical protein GXO43_06945 [Crenarchaeota archaeon]|nr:hypothetical protein [Thermoproteota archaeon]
MIIPELFKKNYLRKHIQRTETIEEKEQPETKHLAVKPVKHVRPRIPRSITHRITIPVMIRNT